LAVLSSRETDVKILIVNRFFGGAQIPTGRMAEDVALKLVEAGHQVTALASSGEYVGAARRADGIQHTVNGIRLEEVRVPKWMPRALAWLWFTRQARKRIPQMEWDVCVLMTDPPLLPLLARRIRRKAYGTRHIAVWLMDLYPEALAASGRITKSNPLYRWYLNKRQRALAACDLLICLGQTQKELLDAGGTRHTANSIRPTRIAVVPPWDDRGNIAPATDESLQNLALYAGNLGEAHCFEEILAAAPYLPADWTIRFATRGAKFAALKAAASELKRPKDEKTKRLGARVETTGYASEEETPGLLASARVHLVTMSPGWEGIVVPSKLYGCIRTGRPVLFIGPENADTAREIRAHDWGKVLPSGASGEEVAAAMLDLAKKPTSSAQVLNGAQLVAKSLEGLAEKCSSTTEH
jgi:hypothetical protein